MKLIIILLCLLLLSPTAYAGTNDWMHLVGCFFIASNPLQSPNDAFYTALAVGVYKETVYDSKIEKRALLYNFAGAWLARDIRKAQTKDKQPKLSITLPSGEVEHVNIRALDTNKHRSP